MRENDCGPVKIEGLLAELDAPNEYWVDPVENFLYFKPNSTDGGSRLSLHLRNFRCVASLVPFHGVRISHIQLMRIMQDKCPMKRL